MNFFRRLSAFFLLVAFALGPAGTGIGAAGQRGSAESRLVAFLHATVIPMDKERVLLDQTVMVANGEIVAIGPADKVTVPAAAFRVDAKGRYLMPALCDMHVHLIGEAWNIMLRPEVKLTGKDVPHEEFLFPFLANGITTVQEMFATPEELVLRSRIASGDLLGPRIILARAIDGPKKGWPPPLTTWVTSALEAQKAVRDAKNAGYDKIKVYSFLDKESYDIIVSTAKELNMDVIGHVPIDLSVDYILQAGQKLIAHSEEVLKHAGGDYSAERINDFAGKMAARGVWMTPTLVTSDSILAVCDNPANVLARPEVAYYRHPMQAGVWSFIIENLYGPIPAESVKKLRDGFERFQKPLTKAFYDKGGRLMVGTDTILPGLVPGFAVHRELAELVKIGLTPFQALRSATTEPFEYLGEIEKAGTIAVGKHSDLVLLDENPLVDVAGASKVAGVLVRGRWISKDEITRRMKEIARPAEGSTKSPASRRDPGPSLSSHLKR